MGAFSWQNATYTIKFILTIYINNEKLMLPRRCDPVEFFSWECGKLRKTAKRGYSALIWPFRTSLFSALSWNKTSHMKLQSLKMFKTTKDMFYKQFDFFLELTGPIMGLREPCPLRSGIAVHSKRSESLITAQHEIHGRSSIEAAARATQHQHNGISPTAPWRFVRDPASATLFVLPLRSIRSCRNQCASVATLQFMNSPTTTLLAL